MSGWVVDQNGARKKKPKRTRSDWRRGHEKRLQRKLRRSKGSDATPKRATW